jgi:hypothetical protein
MVGKGEMIFMTKQASMPVFLHVRQKEGRRKEDRKTERQKDRKKASGPFSPPTMWMKE